MDAEQLIGTLIRGVLGGRRKRSGGALHYLTGGRHSFLNTGTLLAAAGVAWGLYETVTQQTAAPSAAAPGGGPLPPGTGSSAGPSLPPLPSFAGSDGTTAAGPALVPVGAAPVSQTGSAASVPPDVLRVIRLTIAAARADGTLTGKERDAILTHARTVGAESLVAHELEQPTPLPAVVAGAPLVQLDDLYTLAFAVVRADETVSGAERIFLAQLAHQLGLEAAAVAELERAAVERITAAV